MKVYKYFPLPSDRMGTIWTLNSIKDCYIIEYGPAGTTHFAIEGVMQLNGEDQASIYTTDIDETDIALGKEDRLKRSILEIDQKYRPKYIFVMASSVSAIIGTDITSICYMMEDQVEASLIPIETGGYNGDYALGIERTLDLIVKELVQETEVKKLSSYNILGSNIDSFNFLSDLEEIKNLMKEAFGLEEKTVFTAYTDIDRIEEAGQAQFNLVLRGEGLKAAKTMNKLHDLDYYYGRPYGLMGTMKFIEGLEDFLGRKANRDYLDRNIAYISRYINSYKMMVRKLDNRSVALVGDYDTVIGLAGFVEELGLSVDKIMVKHKLSRSIIKSLDERYKDILEDDCDEEVVGRYLEDRQLYLLMGDGASLKLKNQARLKLQIANPNLIDYSIYPYTPFIGFKGALYLIEKLFNLDREYEYSLDI